MGKRKSRDKLIPTIIKKDRIEEKNLIKETDNKTAEEEDVIPTELKLCISNQIPEEKAANEDERDETVSDIINDGLKDSKQKTIRRANIDQTKDIIEDDITEEEKEKIAEKNTSSDHNGELVKDEITELIKLNELDVTDSQLCDVDEKVVKDSKPSFVEEPSLGIEVKTVGFQSLVTNLNSLNQLILDAKKEIAVMRLKINQQRK